MLSSWCAFSSIYEGLHQEGSYWVVYDKIAAADLVPAVICVAHLSLSHKTVLFINNISEYITAPKTYGQ